MGSRHIPRGHIKQHGFQKGKNTETSISNTVHKIERHILNGEHCMGTFLDIQEEILPKHIKSALLKQRFGRLVLQANCTQDPTNNL